MSSIVIDYRLVIVVFDRTKMDVCHRQSYRSYSLLVHSYRGVMMYLVQYKLTKITGSPMLGISLNGRKS